MSIFNQRARGKTLDEPDLKAVYAALAILADPSTGVQLHAAPGWQFRTFRGDDLDAACEWVGANANGVPSGSRGGGVYFNLNPVSPTLARDARVPDILRRRWLLVDVDRNKSMDGDAPATDAEHEAARAMALEVMDWLSEEHGWPPPVVVDSGNGYHLLYRVDLPNDDLSRVLVHKVLKSLAVRFDGPRGDIGVECHDARRVSKLPGTWTRKAAPTPDRPWRLAKIISASDPPLVVSVEQLQEVGGLLDDQIHPPPHANGESNGAPKATPAPKPGGFVLRAVNSRDKAWARAALQAELGRLRMAQPHAGDNGRNATLNRAAFRMGQLVGAGLLTRVEVWDALFKEALLLGLDAEEVKHVLRDGGGLDRGQEKPRKGPDGKPSGTGGSPGNNGTPPGDKPPYTGPTIIRASTVTPRKVKWLARGRLPLGKLVTFAGIGGLGKTFVLCHLTAKITRGLPWPDDRFGEPVEGGQVLFISGEDDPDDTLVPRLMEMGADLTRVTFLHTDIQDTFTLHDIGTLEKALAETGTDVRLVVIDPPTAYLGGTDDHKNAELRQLLKPLKEMSQKYMLTTVFNTHVNKPQGKVEAMMRVMGSVAWVNAVRAAHLFTRDPDDPTRRLFLPMKSNLGAERKGLAYRIKPTSEDMATVEWLGEVDVTADQAVNNEKARGPIGDAENFLRSMFAGTREVAANLIIEARKSAGISFYACTQAEGKLKLRKEQRVVGGQRMWVWLWPDGVPVPPAAAPVAGDDVEEIDSDSDDVCPS